ncbi:14.5K protein [Human adenovirus 54]|uniref:14.5 kDa protein n=1 Tax=Human adenovirus 54 TaxID=651580 RepID=B9A5N2_9ADEN|nr:14.5 kDa protein [Human adenovirus 54]BAH18896.1 14.5kDa protein [Human adenovirus 54]BAH84803.1 14.5 kDa protein [Human adenovirus 54]BAX64524.1 14.5K protein [Human adenovirus 54]BAX64676.1 14.5K protein [Human adenovirus 54]BAX65398.1 14.5K protein [Human adenovirus 54]
MPRKKQEPLVEEMEEEWDSQAEEDEWEEEELEEVEQEQATEQPVAAPSAPAAPPVKPPRRWDRVKGDGKHQRQGYRSWRAHKAAIIACLQDCGGNIAFARRYLLFHRGVNIPRNVLHYYRHLHS